MTTLAKLKRDGAPIVVFGLIVSAKIHSLWIYLTENPKLWAMLTNIGSIDEYGRGATYYLTNELSYLLYFVTAVAFDALVFYSFIVRGEAKSRPEGAWENLFPLITVFVPVIGFTLLFFPQVRQHVPGYSVETLEMLKDITPMYGFYISMLGVTIGFTGAALSIWAISYLKKSFGLRAAVRKLVTRGPYARIRHPPVRRGDHPHLRDRDSFRNTRRPVPVRRRCGASGGARPNRGTEVPANRVGVRGLHASNGLLVASAAQVLAWLAASLYESSA